MDGYLTSNQLDYVLYHLQLYIGAVTDLRENFKFLREGEEPDTEEGKIYFRMSGRRYSREWVREVEGIPLIFPVEELDRFYSVVNGHLIFHHDLLKSIFYLLSGRQEYESEERDKFGRFRFGNSLQQSLGCVRKPVVNYYLEQLHKGFSEFTGSAQARPLKPFDVPFYVMLTHDIDKVAKYNLPYAMANIKRIFGMLPRRRPLGGHFVLLVKSLLGLINMTADRNPYWNFDYILSTGKKFNLRSTFFFLPKNEKGVDADYDLDGKELRQIFARITDDKGEVGVHGTFMSSHSKEESKRNKDLLEKITGMEMKGIRQHRLAWSFPLTPRVQHSAGYSYDATLGFAEHEGFRNSFCYPFKLYDFDADEMMDLWQIPLNVMDVTLSLYRNYDWKQSRDAIREIVSEVKKFGGTLCLLFHNTFLDENEYPEVQNFFAGVLEEITNEGGKGVTCRDLIAVIEQMEKSTDHPGKTYSR